MKTPVLVLALMACAGLGACATGARAFGALPPGHGVDDAMLTAFQCDAATFRAASARYADSLRTANVATHVKSLVPTVGQPACDVLAMLGAPNSSDRITTANGSALTLWYRTGNASADRAAHAVTLGGPPPQRVLVVAW